MTKNSFTTWFTRWHKWSS